ncbi:TetR family transcriptional regulator [Rathayibacter tritici]|uniref:TetR/AcrR family transcriptional regulator n=1 Tax=Rathayibacter tritici TaxID=33888 RepID=UPI000CE8C9E4|nr:TetR family transcriptional regulator [Rathayibacter tritici]PPF29451.1 TetR family transcriptional regulator [Rathayibacter tritici]PPI19476.1 TetR family transcriptional regulator [Rathayibacter tritici]
MAAGVIAPPSRKGAERKEKILETALRIIGRDGLAALSMRTLAAEAELPLGAVSYYFGNKQQLIEETFDLHAQRELRRVIRTISSIGAAGSAADLARVLSDFLIEGLENPDNAIVAEYEFLIEATRRAELARASSAWKQSLHAQLADVLHSRGALTPEEDAGLVMAVLAGLEIDNLTRGELAKAQATDIRRSLNRLFDVMDQSWS